MYMIPRHVPGDKLDVLTTSTMVQADAGSRDESDGAQMMVCRLDMRRKERGAVFGVFRSYLSAMLRKYDRELRRRSAALAVLDLSRIRISNFRGQTDGMHSTAVVTV